MQKNILFVDDDEFLLSSFERMLKKYQSIWNMDFCTNPFEVSGLLRKKEREIVVLDINMPGKSGLDVLHDIKSDSKTKDTQVIILTGHGTRNLKNKALEIGAIDLLDKPVQQEDLIIRIKNTFRIYDYQNQLKIQNKLLEEKLIQAQKMELVGTLAVGAVHDLKNLNQAIITNSDVLQLLSQDETINTRLEKIKNVSIRATKILMQIQMLARKEVSQYEWINVADIINDSLEILQPMMKNFDINWNPDREYPKIWADSTQIFQVIQNLLINSKQAMKNQGKINISLTHNLNDKKNQSGASLTLEITDNGCGMSKEIIEHIFEPHMTTKAAEGGTGMGMFMVKKILDNHGFKIDITSESGVGSTFKIYFPLLLK